METKTSWTDTGRDCPYCGGEILLRSDQLPDGSRSQYHQCRVCEAQWTTRWDKLRSGKLHKIAQQKPSNGRLEPIPHMPRWVWVSLLLVVTLIVIRFTGGTILRILLIPALAILMVWLLYRLGRDQGWWHS